MQIAENLVASIGQTPLLKLRRLSEQTGCTVLGKAEFMNPTASVKDRAARYIIADAEAQGRIEPGGLIVEGTAGNTGIGLAAVGNARGYRTLICIPATQSQEKKDFLRLLGAELLEIPAVPYSNPNQYQHVAKRVAERLQASEPHGVLYADQWDNPANWQGHYQSTGPEIWEQTDGQIDGFVCAIGTGGTLSGVSQYLKERNPAIKIALADPCGTRMYRWFKEGQLEPTEGGSIAEGIGQGRVTANVAGARVDLPYLIPDSEALPILFDLLKEEGLCLGGSSAINLAGARRLAVELGPGHTIVTILCDSGTRYLSKLWNPTFLRGKQLPVPVWLDPPQARPVDEFLVEESS